MLSQIERFFAYDDWANREVLSAIRSATAAPPRSLELLAHVLATERLWYDRLRRQPQAMAVWPELAIEECATLVEELPATWRGYLATLTAEALGATVGYSNTKGEPWTGTVLDILLHVPIHSAYHRGQIAADLRAAGYTPPYTDYIHAVRQGFIQGLRT